MSMMTFTQEENMNRRVLVVTTDGESREDGSVYYAAYYLVEHLTKNFSEPAFTDKSSRASKSDIEALGYIIKDIEPIIITED